MFNAQVLQGFVESVLKRNFDNPVETPACHKEWWELCCGKDRFVAIAAPRGHAKSTAVTHSYVLGAALFRDKKFIVIVSDTEGQAVLFLQNLKREILNNETIRDLFGLKTEKGQVVLFKDTETDLIVDFSDGYQFRIVARGAGQRVRGLLWGNRRPDLVVCDDLENDEIVLNRDRRAKFKGWFYGALRPILSKNGVIRVVGTILHMDSLLENLMPGAQLATGRRGALLRSDGLKEWTDYRLPWKSVKYRAHSPDFSQILWPSQHSEKSLNEIREFYVAQGLPEVYAQEYLNVPLDESHSLFRKSDFLPLEDSDFQRNVNYYVTVDLAISLEERADYSVFAVAALDDRGILQIRNIIRERLDGREIVETLLSLERIYKPVAVGVEGGQIEKTLAPFLRETMISTGTFVSLYPLKSMNKDKVARSRSIQARMRAGGVKFNKDAEWYQTLEDEMMRFPRDKHDDQVDTMSYLGLMVDKLSTANTPEEQAQEEYDREVEEAQLGNDGRSPVTGY